MCPESAKQTCLKLVHIGLRLLTLLKKKVFFKAMRKLGLLAKLYETIIMKIALCFFVWLAKSHFLVALLTSHFS